MFSSLIKPFPGEPCAFWLNTNFNNLPLASSPLPPIGVMLSYLWFVLKFGPAFMRSRPAYNVKYLMLLYNISQILLNFWVAYSALALQLFYRPYDLGCCSSVPLQHPYRYLEERIFYVYYLLKLLDFIDTIFFVLRKNFKQVSFLHVYHHVLMAITQYCHVHYYGTGGQAISVNVLNSLVHVVMYTYYLITALQPQVKYSWWKKYITHMQFVQFLLIGLHHMYPLFFRPDCPYPKIYLYFVMVQSCIMVALFGNFYRKAYMQREKKKTDELFVTNKKEY